jgi:hypothetical protein
VGGTRILSPEEVRLLSPEQRREYLRAIGRTVIEENQNAIAMLVAYDQEETAGVRRGPHAV